MDKVQPTPAQLMEISLRMQGIGVPVNIMEQILETYAVFRRKRGKFSLSDACQIQYKYEQKYPRKPPVNASEEKEQETTIPLLPKGKDLGSVYLGPGEKGLVEIQAKEHPEDYAEQRCEKCCLRHTAYCIQMKCGYVEGTQIEETSDTKIYYQIVRPWK